MEGGKSYSSCVAPICWKCEWNVEVKKWKWKVEMNNEQWKVKWRVRRTNLLKKWKSCEKKLFGLLFHRRIFWKPKWDSWGERVGVKRCSDFFYQCKKFSLLQGWSAFGNNIGMWSKFFPLPILAKLMRHWLPGQGKTRPYLLASHETSKMRDGREWVDEQDIWFQDILWANEIVAKGQ